MLFDNLIANQLCDELASAIAVKENNFPTTFALTGAAAYALQDKYSKDISNIIFKINNTDDYYKLLMYLDKIETKELLKYSERTYFKFQAGNNLLSIMIALDIKAIRFLDYNGINIEDKSLITPDYL